MPQPPDKQIRLICEICPELANKPWDSRLVIEHPHSNLILQMTKQRADYTRLVQYRLCARTKRPLLRLSSPRAVCSRCHRFLEYWSDVAVCIKGQCNTSFCPACVDHGFADMHEHREMIVFLNLLQTAAVASLGLGAEAARKLYLSTTRHIITCTGCRIGDSLMFFEGIFCRNCIREGCCITCLVAGCSLSGPWCQCAKPLTCFNFGLRSDQIFAIRVPATDEKAPGFNAGSTFRPVIMSYDKFPASSKQPLRLLYLQPGKGGQEITFSLRNFSLSSCPQYEALSYTWGTAENPTIFKSTTGETFLATINLARALNQLRYPDKPRMLWIDAVCINQDDNDEKPQQVGIMSSIYSQATRVLLWLGDALANTSKAFAWIRDEPKRTKQKVDQLRIVLQHRPDFMDRLRHLGGEHPTVAPILAAMEFPEAPPDVISPMLELIRRPYFTRVWIIQETFYAKDIVVFCGAEAVDWETFTGACETFWHSKGLKDEYPRVHGVFPGPEKLGKLRGKREWTTSESLDLMLSDYSGGTKTMLKATAKLLHYSSMSFSQASSKLFSKIGREVRNIGKSDQSPERPFRDLLTVLNAFWSYHATNPRDKVFALLNLVKSHQVSVNYDQKISEVFKDVAVAIIRDSRSLELLTMANCARATARQLPSWAPDWSEFDGNSMAIELNQSYRVVYSEIQYMQKYNASQGSALLVKPARTGNVLSLSGYLVDGFAKVGPKMPFYEEKNILAERDAIVDCLLAWDEIAMTPLPYEPGGRQPRLTLQQAETAFCLTLCRGTFWTGAGDANTAMQDFVKWRAALVSLRYRRPPDQQAAIRAQFLQDEQFQIGNLALLSWHNYTVAKTKSGLLVMALGLVEETDHLALMRGCDLPLIVRAVQSIPGRFKLVGPAYVHGIMGGEWWDEKRCQRMDFI